MAVQTTLVNKPLNPRGNDQSPLAFNRAKLFSGKALDFDGVNDYVTFDGFAGTLSTNDAWTACGYFKTDSNTRSTWFSAHHSSGSNRIRVGTETNKDGLFYADSYTTDVQISDFDFKDGHWHFVALSRAQGANGSLVTLLVDGVELTSRTSGPNWDDATQFSLGQEYDGGSTSDFWDGLLANFKIFNTALTAAQVADLYNNPEKVVPTGVDNTALKLWLPMQEGAGTTAYNGAPDALGSELVTNGDFATDSDWIKGTGWSIANGKASKVAGSATELIQLSVFPSGFSSKTFKISFNLEVTAGSVRLRAGLNNQSYLNSSGSYVYCLTPTGNDQLKFGADSSFVGSIDNVSVQEVSGLGTISGATWTNGIGAPVAQTSVIDWNKHTLDGTNAVLIPQGLTSGRDLLGNLFKNVRKQGALNLDGNSWAEVHDNASLDVTTGLSVENWIYIEDAATQGRMLSKWGSTQPNRSFQMFMNNAVVRFLIGNGSSQASLNSSTSLTQGNWHHIVSTYDGANIKIYINGSADATTAETFTIYNSNEPVLIGGYIGGANLSVNPIAQPRIYNRALTAEEVQRNYNAGKNIYS